MLVKYQDKSENKIEMNFIEIIDPRYQNITITNYLIKKILKINHSRGNSYKFKTEMTLSGGEEVMLPRVVNSEGNF